MSDEDIDWSEQGWLRVRDSCICGAKLMVESEPPMAARSLSEMFWSDLRWHNDAPEHRGKWRPA